MLVYHVISDKNVGGAGILLSNLLSFSREPRLCSLVLLPKGSKLTNALKKRRCSWHFMGSASSFSLRDAWHFLRFFRNTPPDLLVSHASLSAKLAAKLCHIPTVTVKHCDLPIKHKRLYNSLTDLTVATSRPLAAHLRASGIGAVACIENGFISIGVPTEAQRKKARAAFGLTEDSIAIGLCGRLSAVKGHETAIFSLFHLKNDKFHLLFMGEGEEKEPLAALALRLGVEKQVHFLGFYADPTLFYQALDAHISCSVASETSSLALAEGMSAALPTFASDTEGNRARVGDGGRLFPINDAKRLADLLRTLTDPKEKKRLSFAALAQSRFLPSVKEMAREYERLFLTFDKKKR